jgi:hypothetical protein
MAGAIRGSGITSIFRASLFEISVCGRRLGVNNRYGFLRQRFLRRHERGPRFGFQFQHAAKVSDFLLHEQAIPALRKAFQSERAKADAF